LTWWIEAQSQTAAYVPLMRPYCRIAPPNRKAILPARQPLGGKIRELNSPFPFS
jgi:hypothetical protein